MKGCDHTFVDSTVCLKCGWTPPATSLTTLQLAERIAEAVLRDAYDSGEGFQWEHVHKRAQAVLGVLYDTDHWFCRLEETAHDGTKITQLPLEFPAR